MIYLSTPERFPQGPWRERAQRIALKGLGGGVFYGLVIEPRWLETTWIDFPVPGLPKALDGYRIAHLTDIHHNLVTGRRYLMRVVGRVNALHPDLIALTGDYITHSPERMPMLARLLGHLRAPDGIFATLGNHDYQCPVPETRQLFADSGIHLLEDEHSVIYPRRMVGREGAPLTPPIGFPFFAARTGRAASRPGEGAVLGKVRAADDNHQPGARRGRSGKGKGANGRAETGRAEDDRFRGRGSGGGGIGDGGEDDEGYEGNGFGGESEEREEFERFVGGGGGSVFDLAPQASPWRHRWRRWLHSTTFHQKFLKDLYSPPAAYMRLDPERHSVHHHPPEADGVDAPCLCVVGVGDLWEGRCDLESALSGAPRGVFRLLLSHNPEVANLVSRKHKIGLVLSGHTHGGQTWPFHRAPVRQAHARRYLRGLIRSHATNVYVSRGVGSSALHFRWNCRPEITIIRLLHAPANGSG